MTAASAQRPKVARLERDNVTFSAYASLGAWGWLLYSAGAFLPLLRLEEGTGRTIMGLHMTVMAVGGLTTSLFTVKIVRRIRRRGAYLVGGAALSLGILLLLAGHRAEFTVPAMAIVGAGGTLLLNASNPMLSDHHGKAGSAALTEGNGVGAGLGLLAPAAVGLFEGSGVGWRPAVAIMIPMMLAGTVFLARIPRGTPAVDDRPAVRHEGQAKLSKTFWLTLVSMVTGVGIELTTVSWGADLIAQRTGLHPSDAATCVTALVFGIAAGRAVIGPLSLRMSVPRIFVGAIAFSQLGWIGLWFATSPQIAVASLLVMGLGIAAHFPLGTSLVYRAAGIHVDRAASIASIGTSIIAITLPTVLGALADRTSTRTAFLAVPILATMAIGFQIAARREYRAAAAGN